MLRYRLQVLRRCVPMLGGSDARFSHSHTLCSCQVLAEHTSKSDRSGLQLILWKDRAPAPHEWRLLQIPSVPPNCSESVRDYQVAKYYLQNARVERKTRRAYLMSFT